MDTITQNMKVKYFSFIGEERTGKVVAIEPYPMDESLVYVYIMNDEYTADKDASARQQAVDDMAAIQMGIRPEVNWEDIPDETAHNDIVNGIPIAYTDVRISTEVYPIEE